MDDPLFDPWGDVAESAPDDATRPAVTPSSDAVPEAPAPPPAAGSTPTSTPRWRPVAARTAPLARPAPKAVDAGPAQPPPGDTPMKSVVLPALRALAQRLEVARHEVRIDDRTDRTSASVRFQVRGWTGPFEDSSVSSAPVLEFVDEEGGGRIAVRTWLEPTANEPSTARVIPSEEVARRLPRILLDFVRTSLGD